MIKGLIHEDVAIVNIYTTNIGATQYTRQMIRVIKEEINSNTKIVGTLTLHSCQRTGHPDRKLNKETQALNDILDQKVLIDI